MELLRKKQRDFLRRQNAHFFKKTSLRPMCPPHHDLRMPNLVIDKSYDPKVKSCTKSNGEKDTRLGIKLADRVKCSEITKRTQIQDIVNFVAKQKWKWAGHVARLKDNRWTLRVTEWQPRNGKRSRGRQARRWRDDIVKTKGNTWSRDARDRDEWKRYAEGYILQWMDRAS
ncbi:endonuclease-reverse transcriptase [Plakobranchus ocellatus]|uniref:Endonuclease-reverse transcriptase n=1 Tax=Plakobranchus ocellatus TaxID=259542 RepID=A0AAV3XXE7_9GAST|nr:endonuclease-reverse transcriptase [Plakobranchus ocellatus]